MNENENKFKMKQELKKKGELTHELYESPLKERNEEKYGILSTAQCICCGKPMKEGEIKFVHMNEGWKALDISVTEANCKDLTGYESQGCFPIGNSCAKKMPSNFITTQKYYYSKIAISLTDSDNTITESNENELITLSIKYKKQLGEITETSKLIGETLRKHYTDDLIKTFKSFNDFLEDINYICEEGGTGKLLFIKQIESDFFSANSFEKHKLELEQLKLKEEQYLREYGKWLMEVWNPNQLYIPFSKDAPTAFLDYMNKKDKEK